MALASKDGNPGGSPVQFPRTPTPLRSTRPSPMHARSASTKHDQQTGPDYLAYSGPALRNAELDVASRLGRRFPPPGHPAGGHRCASGSFGGPAAAAHRQPPRPDARQRTRPPDIAVTGSLRHSSRRRELTQGAAIRRVLDPLVRYAVWLVVSECAVCLVDTVPRYHKGAWPFPWIADSLALTACERSPSWQFSLLIPESPVCVVAS